MVRIKDVGAAMHTHFLITERKKKTTSKNNGAN